MQKQACHHAKTHPPWRLDDDGDGQVHVVRVHQAHLHVREPMGRQQQHVPGSGLIIQRHSRLELTRCSSSSWAAASEQSSCAASCHASQRHQQQALSPVCPRAHRYAGVARKGGVHGVVCQHLRRHRQIKGV